MAAATVTLDGAGTSSSAFRLFRNIKNLLNVQNGNPDGLLLPLDSGAFTPASTSTDDIGDELRVLKFPKGYKLWDLQIIATADVDSGGTALVYDLIVDDGTTETTLISGCTIGASASGTDALDATVAKFLDVGNQWLALKITTPATANAGTGSLRVRTLGYMGNVPNPNA